MPIDRSFRSVALGLAVLLAACGGDKVTLGGGVPIPGVPVSALDGGVTTTLAQLPPIDNVAGVVREDSVGLDFDPVDGAKDYRIYPLPKDADITNFSDGGLVVKNAIYRCAGYRQTHDVPNGSPKGDKAYAQQFPWDVKPLDKPTLGYVYNTDGAGRVPVYAVGMYPSAGEVGWRESRPKIYTTDPAVRKMYLALNGRDDGIVFYVPATADATTHPVYFSETAEIVAGQGWTQHSEYYFTDDDLQKHMGDKTPPTVAFPVLTAAAAGTRPLMGTLYQPPQRHIELSVGNERYQRALNQGAGPMWHVEWAPITETTVLVIEALDGGCPFQGLLSAAHLDAPPHQTMFTLAELQAAATDGEVFINGQYDTKIRPKPIARSFIRVSPQPHNPADWDWYEGFSGDNSDYANATPGGMVDVGDQWSIRYATSRFDIGGYALDKSGDTLVQTFGVLRGQLWTVFDDTAQDVTGTMRITPLQKTSVDSDATKFLHITWSVDIVSTGRRYPQLIVSDQSIPVQKGLGNADGNSLLIQTIGGPSSRFETQAIHGLVNGRAWAVNNQAPEHRFIDYDNWSDASKLDMPPNESPQEHAGMDRMVKFDAYVSSDRVYTFMDGTPAGCTKYPGNNGFHLSGPVTVTFGDVIYHEGAPDEGVCSQTRPFPFMNAHQCMETKRHWDDLGWKAGVAPPTWDETKLPCSDY